MLAIMLSTLSVLASSTLNESALDLERPSLADEGRDLDNPRNDFLFGVLLASPLRALSGEKRLALRGRILCWLVSTDSERCSTPFFTDSSSTE